MSFTVTIENDTIKLPTGIHFPNGTRARLEPLIEKGPIQEDDPMYRLSELAVPGEPMTDREMDAAIYGI